MKYIMLLISVLSLFACQSPNLSAEFSSLDVSGEENTIVIEVNSSSPWSISFDDWWVSFSSSRGNAGEYELIATVKENPEPESRKGEITLRSGDMVKTYQLTQQACNKLQLSAENICVGWEGETVTVEVESNLDYDILIKDDWLEQVEVKSLNKSSYSFRADKNEGSTVRETEVIFSNTRLGVTAILHVVQNCQQSLVEYKKAAGVEFPIIAYFGCGQTNFSRVSKKNYEQLAACGFNVSLATFGGADRIMKALDCAKETGVRLITGGPTTTVPDLVEEFKGEDGIYAFFVCDEPSMDQREEIKDRLTALKAADPHRMFYLNLLGQGAQYKNIKTTDYQAYLNAFMDAGPSMLSYDNYCIRGEEPVLGEYYFENLQRGVETAKKYNVPCWTFVLSCTHLDYYLVDQRTMRFQAWNAIAYGSSGIQYFTYEYRSDVYNGLAALVGPDDKPTEKYYMAQRLNREIQGLADIFLGMSVKCVRGIGREESGLPAVSKTDLPASIKSIVGNADAGLLMSRFTNGGHEYMMLVNLDWYNPQNVALELEDESVVEFIPTDEYPSGFGTRVAGNDRTIPAGDMALYRIK